MISDALTVAAIFAGGGLLGYIIGAARGRKRGRDEKQTDDSNQKQNEQTKIQRGEAYPV